MYVVVFGAPPTPDDSGPARPPRGDRFCAQLAAIHAWALRHRHALAYPLLMTDLLNTRTDGSSGPNVVDWCDSQIDAFTFFSVGQTIQRRQKKDRIMAFLWLNDVGLEARQNEWNRTHLRELAESILSRWRKQNEVRDDIVDVHNVDILPHPTVVAAMAPAEEDPIMAADLLLLSDSEED